jgi:hypothetical protein
MVLANLVGLAIAPKPADTCSAYLLLVLFSVKLAGI